MKKSVINVVLLIFIFAIVPAIALANGGAHSTEEGFTKGSLDLWTHETFIAIVATLYLGVALVQLSRSYFLRILKKFTLRLGADIWWLTFILLRDGLMVITFILGLMLLHPHIYEAVHLAVPFAPFSIILLGVALLIKLIWDADENAMANFWVSICVMTGVMLNLFSLLFFMEGGHGFPFEQLKFYFSSLLNPELARRSLQVSHFYFFAIGLIAFIYFIKNNLTRVRKVENFQYTLVHAFGWVLFILVLLIALMIYFVMRFS